MCGEGPRKASCRGRKGGTRLLVVRICGREDLCSGVCAGAVWPIAFIQLLKINTVGPCARHAHIHPDMHFRRCHPGLLHYRCLSTAKLLGIVICISLYDNVKLVAFSVIFCQDIWKI